MSTFPTCKLLNSHLHSPPRPALFFSPSTLPPQVMDLVLQRLLEVPDMAARSLEQLLELYGPLYKFHGKQHTHTPGKQLVWL